MKILRRLLYVIGMLLGSVVFIVCVLLSPIVYLFTGDMTKTINIVFKYEDFLNRRVNPD